MAGAELPLADTLARPLRDLRVRGDPPGVQPVTLNALVSNADARPGHIQRSAPRSGRSAAEVGRRQPIRAITVLAALPGRASDQRGELFARPPGLASRR
jgi:hypothetical protein